MARPKLVANRVLTRPAHAYQVVFRSNAGRGAPGQLLLDRQSGASRYLQRVAGTSQPACSLPLAHSAWRTRLRSPEPGRHRLLHRGQPCAGATAPAGKLTLGYTTRSDTKRG